ncbi:hypothetical protein Ancab_005446 [Ancistrocladus abbreviatus]
MIRYLGSAVVCVDLVVVYCRKGMEGLGVREEELELSREEEILLAIDSTNGQVPEFHVYAEYTINSDNAGHNSLRSMFHLGSNLNTKTPSAHEYFDMPLPSTPTVDDWYEYSGSCLFYLSHS